MGVSFQRERLDRTLFEEMAPMNAAHSRAIAAYPDIPLNIDEELYIKMDGLDILRVYTARNEGELIGYSFFTVIPHPQYKTSLQANEECIFFSPDARRGMTGFNFLSWCDKELEKEGVQVIRHSVSVRYDFSPLLRRLGYDMIEGIYSRRVK